LGIGVDFDFEALVFGDMHGKHGAAACPVNVEHCYNSTSCGIIGRTKNTPLKYLNAILVCSFGKNFPKPFDNFGLGVPAAEIRYHHCAKKEKRRQKIKYVTSC
jgi:hypothetical protein